MHLVNQVICWQVAPSVVRKNDCLASNLIHIRNSPALIICSAVHPHSPRIREHAAAPDHSAWASAGVLARMCGAWASAAHAVHVYANQYTQRYCAHVDCELKRIMHEHIYFWTRVCDI